MRIDHWKPTKGAPDPLTRVGVNFSFTSGHIDDKNPVQYDIYMVGGVVYVCRGGHVGIFFEHGVCFVSGEEGKRLSSDFAKKWPRPKAEDAVKA